MSTPASASEVKGRWRHLIIAIICMILIANLQYGWSVFVAPLTKAVHGWDGSLQPKAVAAAVQFAFTFFVFLETWGTPVGGWFTDRIGPRFGPRTVVGVGGVLCALGWVINASAGSLTMLYVGNFLTGVGAGFVYCVCVGTAVKWFPDRRGLASGLVAGGFGAGAALTILPIDWVIKAHGYQAAFLWFGLFQGILVLIIAQFLRHPNPGEVPAVASKANQQSKNSYTTVQMLSSWVFWVLYVCDVLMCAGGLVIAANLKPLGVSYHHDTAIIVGMAALSLTLVLSNISNGVGRPIFGWISDKIGLPLAMVFSYGIGAVAYFFLAQFGANPWMFLLGILLVMFCWGNIFSLFPSMCTNIFGPKYATTNTSVLYTAKGTAALLVPLAGSLITMHVALQVCIAINIVAVLIVWFILRPAAIRFHVVDASKTVAQPA